MHTFSINNEFLESLYTLQHFDCSLFRTANLSEQVP